MKLNYSDNIIDACEEISPETPFLIKLFQRFEKQTIDYCVLRNHTTLPTSHGGSDIDILFSPACFQIANRIISDTACDCGGCFISEIRAHRVISRSFCGCTQGEWWGVRFDTFSYVGTNGCDIFYPCHMSWVAQFIIAVSGSPARRMPLSLHLSRKLSVPVELAKTTGN